MLHNSTCTIRLFLITQDSYLFSSFQRIMERTEYVGITAKVLCAVPSIFICCHLLIWSYMHGYQNLTQQYNVSQKNPPWGFLTFFSKTVRNY